jgi:hypothetical protein
LPNLPLDDALQLVYLSAERGQPKYERAAMRDNDGALRPCRAGRAFPGAAERAEDHVFAWVVDD